MSIGEVPDILSIDAGDAPVLSHTVEVDGRSFAYIDGAVAARAICGAEGFLESLQSSHGVGILPDFGRQTEQWSDLPAPLASYRNAHMAVPLPLFGVREYTHE